jgi:hypothetical protein
MLWLLGPLWFLHIRRGWISFGHWALGMFAALWLPLHIWIGRRRLRRDA